MKLLLAVAVFAADLLKSIDIANDAKYSLVCTL